MKVTKGALPRQQDHLQEGSQPVAATGHRSLLIPLDKFSSFASPPPMSLSLLITLDHICSPRRLHVKLSFSWFTRDSSTSDLGLFQRSYSIQSHTQWSCNTINKIINVCGRRASCLSLYAACTCLRLYAPGLLCVVLLFCFWKSKLNHLFEWLDVFNWIYKKKLLPG